MLCNPSSRFVSGQDTSDQTTKIDKLVLKYVECCQFSGTVLVSEHDNVIFKKGYGLANREWNLPNSLGVKFRIGSITKQFSSMLVMKQATKGTIKLDGPFPIIFRTTGKIPDQK